MRALVLAENPQAAVRVCGPTLLERLLRSLAQSGCTQATVLSADPGLRAAAAAPTWPRAGLSVRAQERAATGPLTCGEAAATLGGSPEPALVVPVAGAWDKRLLATLLAARASPVVLVDGAPPPRWQPLLARAPRAGAFALCGPAVVDGAWLADQDPGRTLEAVFAAATARGAVACVDVAGEPDYVAPMRRHVRPLWFPAPDAATAALAERMVLDAAQKGALDLPARVHGPIETFFVSFLCRTPITPNQLTVISALVAWGATALFATGQLAAGVAVAMAVGVIDGLDGKQARVKLETSALGELEHVSDFLFELSWWSALAFHFWHSGQIPEAPYLLLALYAAEGVDGLCKLAVKRKLGRLIDDLGPATRALRLVAGRRNVYTWIMAAGVLLGAPAAAYRLLPIWEGASALLHLVAAAVALRPGVRAVVAPAVE